jgi:PhoH-like ATPase
MRNKTKLFVLDTNVILHDSSSLFNFGDNDIVIPICVLEELDNFKKGHEALNYHARNFLRTLDELGGDSLFNKGVQISKDHGKILVKLQDTFHKDIESNFSKDKLDHQILNCAYVLSKQNASRTVILVSKDVNLRLKAKAVGLLSKDYTTDKVKDISSLYTGNRTIEDVDISLIEMLYKEPFEIDANLLKDYSDFTPNEYLILKNQKQSVLATFDYQKNKIIKIDKFPCYGINPRNAEQTFALDALLNPQIKLVTISGRAGTGKTLLALAAALERKRDYRQIFLARPVVALSNKDLGFLPGDVAQKLDPYMQPLFDNLGVIQEQHSGNGQKQKNIKDLLEEEKLVISPLAYIRGRSLNRIYFIVDEAQNLTPHEIKTIITRAGEGTKVIFTGDIFQIDHPYLDSQSNGLSHLIEKMQGQKIYAHITLEKGERSELADIASGLL